MKLESFPPNDPVGVLTAETMQTSLSEGADEKDEEEEDWEVPAAFWALISVSSIRVD